MRQSINTLLCNLKTVLTCTYQAFEFAKYARSFRRLRYFDDQVGSSA